MERAVGLVLGVVVVAEGWELVFGVAWGSEDPGVMRGMLIDALKPSNGYGTLQ